MLGGRFWVVGGFTHVIRAPSTQIRLLTVISRITPLELAPSFSHYYYVSYTSVYGSTTPRYAIQRCVARQPIREPQADNLLDVALSTDASHAQFIEYSGNVDQRQCQCHERPLPTRTTVSTRTTVEITVGVCVVLWFW